MKEGAMEKATDRPWWKGSWRGQCHKKHAHGGETCVYEYTRDTSTNCVSSPEENVELIGYDDYGQILSAANAALIVEAVNAYDTLREKAEALDECVAALKEAQSVAQCSPDALALINAALTRAKAIAGADRG